MYAQGFGGINSKTDPEWYDRLLRPFSFPEEFNLKLFNFIYSEL